MVKMATFEEIFEQACVDKEIPGAVLVATDKTGRFYIPPFYPRWEPETELKSRRLQICQGLWVSYLAGALGANGTGYDDVDGVMYQAPDIYSSTAVYRERAVYSGRRCHQVAARTSKSRNSDRL